MLSPATRKPEIKPMLKIRKRKSAMYFPKSFFISLGIRFVRGFLITHLLPVKLLCRSFFRIYRQKVTATMLSQTASHPVFQLLAQMAHVCFTGKSGYTLAFQRKIAHGGSHAETRAFRMGGWYHYPRSVPHIHKHPRAGYQNDVLCRF